MHVEFAVSSMSMKLELSFISTLLYHLASDEKRSLYLFTLQKHRRFGRNEKLSPSRNSTLWPGFGGEEFVKSRKTRMLCASGAWNLELI